LNKKDKAELLVKATRMEQLETVKYFIEEKKFDVNENATKEGYGNHYRTTALYDAVEKNYIEIVKYLLSKKAKIFVSFIMSDNVNAFFIAAAKGYIEIMKLLLETGQINMKNEEESLNAAVQEGKTEAIRFILDETCKLRLSWPRNRPIMNKALAIACEKGYENIVVMLLDAGAIMNRIPPGGTIHDIAPLTEAVKNDHKNIVRILLDRGADPNIRISWNIATPLNYIKNGNENDEMKQMLIDAGGYRSNNKCCSFGCGGRCFYDK